MTVQTSQALEPAPPAPASEAPPVRAAAAWWAAARPATLSLGALPVVVATALAHADGRAAPLPALAALAGALAIQVGTNLHNDAADAQRGADGPDRLGPPRATQRGWLSAAQVRRGAALAFALAVVAGAYLSWTAGWPLLVIGVASIACGLAYTGGPFPLAYLGLGDPFVLLFFGVVATCGAYYVQAGAVPAHVIAASLPIGLLATAVLVVNNLRDRAGDARAGKRTLAVRLGARLARAEYALCVLGAFAAPLAAWGLDLAPRGWLLALVALPLGLWQVAKLTRLDGAALNPELGATARLQLVYGLLLAGGALL
ncbi:MAG: 1,4-dihydroxy-2-naphthoate polyprenyltransferase [Planctomycetota bacterium]